VSFVLFQVRLCGANFEFSGLRSLQVKVLGQNRPNTACTGQVRGFARTFGVAAPTADSASGGFSSQFPPLPVTPAVGLFFLVQVFVLGFWQVVIPPFQRESVFRLWAFSGLARQSWFCSAGDSVKAVRGFRQLASVFVRSMAQFVP
jgi:hypothetical protein